MYTACLFCHSRLGTNDLIEPFPVGRRLAFDGAKGRLWVICPRCARWNLTPLEERWEAIEACERQFRAATLRAATTHIGLARLRAGLDLIRIGPVLKPELALWRYGKQFVRRRRAGQVARLTLFGAGVLGGAVLPGIGMALGWTAAAGVLVGVRWREVESTRRRLKSVVARAPETDAPGGIVRAERVFSARLLAAPDQSWLLRLQYRPGFEAPVRHVELAGPEAMRALRLLLPSLNAAGARRRVVEDATRLIEEIGTGDRFAAGLSTRIERSIFKPRELRHLPHVDRLALEMASSEELEHRAMEGELAPLEAAWREAEEIAAIADDLLISDAVRGRFDALTHFVDGFRT